MGHLPDPAAVDHDVHADQDEALLALGRWFMARAELSLGVSSHPDELSEVLALRRRHVQRAGWEPGERSTAEEERDGHDDTAVHLCAWDGAVLAGTARIILPTSRTLLPTEEAFGMRIEPVGKVVECGRWVVADRYRSHAHRVSMGLSGLACLEVVSRGYAVWAGMTSSRVIELWRGFGFEMETLSQPRSVLGAGRLAVRCDLRASLPGLLRVLGPLGAPVPM
jgi:hypothetical protein